MTNHPGSQETGFYFVTSEQHERENGLHVQIFDSDIFFISELELQEDDGHWWPLCPVSVGPMGVFRLLIFALSWMNLAAEDNPFDPNLSRDLLMCWLDKGLCSKHTCPFLSRTTAPCGKRAVCCTSIVTNMWLCGFVWNMWQRKPMLCEVHSRKVGQSLQG
ncbi:Hypothetical predicted protein [Podarcis lilfordi]|uniref:Uncharacterized protein n=1 Tax=Podarcis lilfordi TaxID=74358 RepID=A0AA35K4L4_9SAUR|nr:Hypothetical predicted protein [Podarcis lilfordi]